MARALLAWEFGGDLGHARRVLSIARGIREMGHEPVLALADLAALDSSDARGLTCFQAPRLAMAEVLAASPLNASDVLLNLGFADARGLAGALIAWQGLARLLQPDVFVCDYAPTALLAARAMGIARVTVGTGFSNPPTGQPMPALRGWAPSDEAALADRDSRLVAAVREAWMAAGFAGAAPGSASELFAADDQLVCAWPEVDPFGPRTQVTYLGPQADEATAKAVTWNGDARPRLVAYLKPRDPRFELVRRAIDRAGGEAIAAVPGLPAHHAPALCTGKVQIIAGPVDLGILEGADLCVSHGGPGIVWAAMSRGTPQALLPLHLEQYLVSRRAVDAGIATLLEPEQGQPDVDAWLQQALANAALRQAAAAVAETVRDRIPLNAAERIAGVMKG